MRLRWEGFGTVALVQMENVSTWLSLWFGVRTRAWAIEIIQVHDGKLRLTGGAVTHPLVWTSTVRV